MFEKSLFRSAVALAVMVLLIGTAGAVTIDLVPVGNPGNGNDPETGYGSVAEPYLIGQYEVTAGQYTEFLNAVAATDTYGLYNTEMWTSAWGCKIERTGSSGSYTYSVAPDRAHRPVNWVSWGGAVCQLAAQRPTNRGTGLVNHRRRGLLPRRGDEHHRTDGRHARE